MVTTRYGTRWLMTMALYSRLRLYRTIVTSVTASIWWHVCRQHPAATRDCKLVVRLTAGEHALRAGKGRHTAESVLCQNCELFEEETLDHLLCRCTHPQLMAVRETGWRKLTELIPPAMRVEVQAMTDQQRVSFLLSGLGGGYVRPWQDLYVCAAAVVATTYKTRLSLNDNM